jgi:peptidyl-prolyl cis-trans isomerase B (cyclophilin B)
VVSNEQRRRQLAREKYRRQQERRQTARRKARRRNAVIAAVLVVMIGAGAAVAATGALSKGKDKQDAAATPSAAPTTKAPDPCAKGAAAAKGKPDTKLSWKKEPPLTIDKSAKYTMKLATTCGDITVAMDAAKAPHTVNSFDFLAAKGFFDHTKCHLLVDSGIYVLQCGDPTGTGSGGPGYTIPDENLKDPKLKGGVYPAGTVAMANRYDGTDASTRNTGGSQFFLVYQDSKLPPDYTPFGTITGGMSVLNKIAKAGAAAPDPTTGNTAPNATVIINKLTVTKS